MNKQQAVKHLREGKSVTIYTNNGSCQAGDTQGTLFIKDGTLMLKTTGDSNYAWQQYSGPARKCQIPYGFGATSRAVAILLEQGQDIEVPFSFSQGTSLAEL